MPAERAGYSVTIFLVDVSPSMGARRTVALPPGPNNEERSTEISNLEWALQFVKLKIQDMIFNGRKTEQCGVITFGSEGTENIVNEKQGGYEHVSEYIAISQPDARTLAKLDELRPSETTGDSVDALIVAIETQDAYLKSKSTWQRKIALITDGESPIEIEDWEAMVKKMTALEVTLTVVGVDFDDAEMPYSEEDKSAIKRANESFYAHLISSLPENTGLFGTLARALQSLSYPSIKETKSALLQSTLRLGDVETREEEAIEIGVRIAKCTSSAKLPSLKRFSGHMVDEEDEERKVLFTELKRRTEYFIDRSSPDDKDKTAPTSDVPDEDEEGLKDESHLEKVEKEQLIRGFKYGATYVPCPDGQFEKLHTKKGIDISGFFPAKNFNRSYPLSEVSYLFSSPTSAPDQVAFSSIVQAMFEMGVLAIARMVTRDGADPKIGVLSPVVWENIDVLLWVQMPFADDIRHYTFPSLTTLISRTGERVSKHPYIPTPEQLEAMDKYIDDMDLMDAGEKDEDSKKRLQWFDTRFSYNPAVHRTKQALFHAAVVPDLSTYPLLPPHPELLKYFEPPKRVLKRARKALDDCKDVFKTKEVPKKVLRVRKDGHVRAADENEDVILLDLKGPAKRQSGEGASTSRVVKGSPETLKKRETSDSDSDTESESDDDELILASRSKAERGLPTPTASPEPELEIDPQCAPGRIIGNTFPLKDFLMNLSRGDVVTKAVEDLGTVIREVVSRPFASRRHEEMLECLQVLRDNCLKEDEVDAWNSILEGLKNECLAEMGNKEFWIELQKRGRSMSLISDSEADKVGTISRVSDSAAESFIQQ